VATQAHPEFLSRPTRAHPLFTGLVAAAMEHARSVTAGASRRAAASA
jgi:CTP synthase